MSKASVDKEKAEAGAGTFWSGLTKSKLEWFPAFSASKPSFEPTEPKTTPPKKIDAKKMRRASHVRRSTIILPADPVARRFMDQYKDHSRTAYHHEDDIWEDATDVKGLLNRIASRRHGRLPKDHIATSIDSRDTMSPDSWIPRNPDLRRLTGKHPLNAEPDPVDLFNQGFITPVSLHYVRNHGKSPRIDWGNHRLTISGLVEKAATWTMDELIKMPATTIPVSTCCSGQRRKEMNMIAKTAGFNWSTAAISCNLWTGVKLSVLLEHCGVDMNNARFVWLEGAEAEALPNGTYGTSIPVVTATNPYDYVLIAWQQNGVPLTPDHGFPVRCIVPGNCGGRSVKWLENIKVMDRPSENFYHFHDNRILPPFVDAQLATEEGWYFRDDYMYNQLGVNSIIACPNHQETIHANEHGSYTLKGFGYSGGGRKVTRIELSFDGGKTWKMCSTDYPEERYSDSPKFGKYFAWMFWEYTIDKSKLLKLAEKGCNIRVRAWDVSSNTQPSEPTWNLLGQGNNCQYIVQMEMHEENGLKYVEFIHPVAEGNDTSGWMKLPESAEEVELEKMKKEKSEKHLNITYFTKEEIEKHNSDESAWLIVNDSVYDATQYLQHHPGGAESIIMNAGSDATEDFLAIHSKKAKMLLEDFFIGKIRKSETVPVPAPVSKISDEVELVALHPKKWNEFELFERIEVSHDTRLFKFLLQSPKHRLGLPVGHHMFIQAVVDGKTIVRAYTPISSDDDLGMFTLCVKVYFADVHPKFPEGGKMSQYLENMKLGDKLKAKGPLGHIEYKGDGKLIIRGKEVESKKIGMLCGGTGLTPAYQVLQAIYKNPQDKTEISLLYANRTENDILMKKELEQMAAKRENIKVHFTLTDPPEHWKHSTGRVSEEMIKEHMPVADGEHFIGMCGPPLMIKLACIPNLEILGHKEQNMMVF